MSTNPKVPVAVKQLRFQTTSQPFEKGWETTLLQIVADYKQSKPEKTPAMMDIYVNLIRAEKEIRKQLAPKDLELSGFDQLPTDLAKVISQIDRERTKIGLISTQSDAQALALRAWSTSYLTSIINHLKAIKALHHQAQELKKISKSNPARFKQEYVKFIAARSTLDVNTNQQFISGNAFKSVFDRIDVLHQDIVKRGDAMLTRPPVRRVRHRDVSEKARRTKETLATASDMYAKLPGTPVNPDSDKAAADPHGHHYQEIPGNPKAPARYAKLPSDDDLSSAPTGPSPIYGILPGETAPPSSAQGLGKRKSTEIRHPDYGVLPNKRRSRVSTTSETGAPNYSQIPGETKRDISESKASRPAASSEKASDETPRKGSLLSRIGKFAGFNRTHASSSSDAADETTKKSKTHKQSKS